MIVKGIKRYSWILLVIMLAVFWKAPLHAEAATTQVDNLVLMVNFSEDGDNTFSTNFNKYQEMYTGTASAPKRSLEKYISTISDEQVKVNQRHQILKHRPAPAFKYAPARSIAHKARKRKPMFRPNPRKRNCRKTRQSAF